MPKKNKCGKPKGVHYFNGKQPFGWQECQCKKFTFQELKDINTQNLIEAKGEAVT